MVDTARFWGWSFGIESSRRPPWIFFSSFSLIPCFPFFLFLFNLRISISIGLYCSTVVAESLEFLLSAYTLTVDISFISLPEFLCKELVSNFIPPLTSLLQCCATHLGMAQHSNIARSAIMSNATNPSPSHDTASATSNGIPPTGQPRPDGAHDSSPMAPSKTVAGRALGNELHSENLKPPAANEGVGIALTDTPVSTAPSSPQM